MNNPGGGTPKLSGSDYPLAEIKIWTGETSPSLMYRSNQNFWNCPDSKRRLDLNGLEGPSPLIQQVNRMQGSQKFGKSCTGRRAKSWADWHSDLQTSRLSEVGPTGRGILATSRATSRVDTARQNTETTFPLFNIEGAPRCVQHWEGGNSPMLTSIPNIPLSR